MPPGSPWPLANPACWISHAALVLTRPSSCGHARRALRAAAPATTNRVGEERAGPPGVVVGGVQHHALAPAQREHRLADVPQRGRRPDRARPARRSGSAAASASSRSPNDTRRTTNAPGDRLNMRVAVAEARTPRAPGRRPRRARGRSARTDADGVADLLPVGADVLDRRRAHAARDARQALDAAQPLADRVRDEVVPRLAGGDVQHRRRRARSRACARGRRPGTPSSPITTFDPPARISASGSSRTAAISASSVVASHEPPGGAAEAQGGVVGERQDRLGPYPAGRYPRRSCRRSSTSNRRCSCWSSIRRSRSATSSSRGASRPRSGIRTSRRPASRSSTSATSRPSTRPPTSSRTSPRARAAGGSPATPSRSAPPRRAPPAPRPAAAPTRRSRRAARTRPTSARTTRSARASPTTRSSTATRAASPTRSGASARSRASTSRATTTTSSSGRACASSPASARSRRARCSSSTSPSPTPATSASSGS